MRVLLLNPPHRAVASRCHEGRMPPLGLLTVGGPLIDAGHDVRLLDTEIGPLSLREIVAAVESWTPDAVLIGHSGSTSAHPVIVEITRALRESLPGLWIVYGGVYPTYHAQEILAANPQIDVIVRGEGEGTTPRVLEALQTRRSLSVIPGIGYRENGSVSLTPAAMPIPDLDACRVGWELIADWDRYQYWGAGRAAVVQFSRGCPHQCTYCGQRGFWTRWRHRDPVRVAREIGWLHRTHDVRFVDLADENPTTSPRLWREFLEAMIAEDVPVQFVAAIRAGDLVRDADFLELYKRAGFSRILMGMETTDSETQERIRKGASVACDQQAIQLLRRHDILSQAAYVVGFEQETDRDLFRGLRQLLAYDPDQINAMYVTPHRWTPFYRESANRRVIESDQHRWDYRHQVLDTNIPAWRVFLWVKLTEVVLQLRPRALWRVFAHRDRSLRKALRWCYGVGRRAWLFEVREFLFSVFRHRPRDLSLSEFWGVPQDEEEDALTVVPLTIHRKSVRESEPLPPPGYRSVDDDSRRQPASPLHPR